MLCHGTFQKLWIPVLVSKRNVCWSFWSCFWKTAFHWSFTRNQMVSFPLSSRQLITSSSFQHRDCTGILNERLRLAIFTNELSQMHRVTWFSSVFFKKQRRNNQVFIKGKLVDKVLRFHKSITFFCGSHKKVSRQLIHLSVLFDDNEEVVQDCLFAHWLRRVLEISKILIHPNFTLLFSRYSNHFFR